VVAGGELGDGRIELLVAPGCVAGEATGAVRDVESAEAREFGDKRVKLVFEDDEGNEVQVALFPEDVRSIACDIEALEDDSPVFE